MTDTRAPTDYDVRFKTVQRHSEMATKAFADHKITVELESGVFRSYSCGRDGSGVYRFRITTFPGSIVVTGDIGELIVQRCRDMFTWVPGAINSIDYFEEKVPHSIETKEYDPDLVRAWLADIRADDPSDDMKENLTSVERYIDDGEHFVNHEIYETLINEGNDWPDFKNFSSRFLWCREAIKWFFENYRR